MREPLGWVTGRGVLYAGVLGHLIVGAAHLSLDVVREHYVGHLEHFLFEVLVLVGLPVAMLALVRRLERRGSSAGGLPAWPGRS